MTRVFIFIESTTMVTTPRRSRCLLLFITAIEIVLPSLSFVRKNCIGVADGLEGPSAPPDSTPPESSCWGRASLPF